LVWSHQISSSGLHHQCDQSQICPPRFAAPFNPWIHREFAGPRSSDLIDSRKSNWQDSDISYVRTHMRCKFERANREQYSFGRPANLALHRLNSFWSSEESLGRFSLVFSPDHLLDFWQYFWFWNHRNMLQCMTWAISACTLHIQKPFWHK
jgi:hypothetical protein